MLRSFTIGDMYACRGRASKKGRGGSKVSGFLEGLCILRTHMRRVGVKFDRVSLLKYKRNKKILDISDKVL